MTTNSPNPVDGDVQALIEHIKKWKEGSTFFDSVIEFNKRQSQIYEIALAALTAEPVAWVVMAPHGDYIERNSDVVAHLEGTGLAKCKPLFTTPPAHFLRPVELPNLLQPGADGYDDWYMHSSEDGEYMKADDVIAALEAAGVPYEVKS